MAVTYITVGRVSVPFTFDSDENIVEVPRYEHDCDEVSFRAEYRQRYDDGTWKWVSLGTFSTRERACKELYINRPDFTVMYG